MITRTLTLLFLVALPVLGQDPEDATLAQGLYAEEVLLDLDLARKRYKTLLQHFEQQRKIAATAQYRLAECERKLKNDAAAAAGFERIITGFPEEDALVTLAEDQLKAMGRALPYSGTVSPDLLLTREERDILDNLRFKAKNSPDLLEERDASGRTPLYRAVEANHLHVVAFLLEKGTDGKPRVDPNAPAMESAGSPLDAAARLGHLAMAKRLVDAGADVQTQGWKGLQALHHAVWSERDKFVAYLLEVGAVGRAAGSFGWRWGELTLHTMEGFPLDPFQLAVLKRRPVEILEALLEKGGGLDAELINGKRLIHLVSEAGWVEELSFLLRNGADVHAVTHDGRSPVHFAADEATLRILGVAEADLTATDDAGRTALDGAAMRNQVALCEALLLFGCKADARAHDGYDPLARAVMHEAHEVVALLIAREMEAVNRRYVDRKSLLMLAKGPEMVERLIQAGADVHGRDAHGNTALHVFVHSEADAILPMLVTQGVDVFAKNRDGKRAFDLRHSAYLMEQMRIRKRQEESLAIWQDRDPILRKSERTGETVEWTDVMVASGIQAKHEEGRGGIDPLAIPWGTTVDGDRTQQTVNVPLLLDAAKKSVTVRAGGREKVVETVPAIIDPGVYVPGYTWLVASHLRPFLNRAGLVGLPVDLTKVVLTRADGRVLRCDATQPAWPGEEIWLRDGDTIALLDLEETLEAASTIVVTREADLFSQTLWSRERDHLRFRAEGEPGRELDVDVIDALAAAYQSDVAVLADTDWDQCVLMRGDERMVLPWGSPLPEDRQWLALQWGDRLELPRREGESQTGPVTLPDHLQTLIRKGSRCQIAVNDREVVLQSQLYHYSISGRFAQRKRLVGEGNEAVIPSFWLADVLEQLGYSAPTFDMNAIELNGELVVDSAARLQLVGGDRVVVVTASE